MTSPQLPNLDFPTINMDSFHINPTGNHQPRSQSNSVPNITLHHHDSASSVSSQDTKTSFPYFDASLPSEIYELEQPAGTPSFYDTRHRKTSSTFSDSIQYENGLHPALYTQSPPDYAPETTASGYPFQSSATDPTRSQSESSVGMSEHGRYRTFSNAQERRRRAKARFETG